MRQETFKASGPAGRHQRNEFHHWEALLDSSSEGICGLDIEGNCTFLNRTALETLGFADTELVGSNLHEMVHHHHADGRSYPVDDCPIHHVIRSIKSHLHQMSDTMFRKDGTAFTAEISARPVRFAGEVTGAILTFRDVTDGRKQQEDLEEACRLAEERTAELNAVIESIPHGIFIATHKDGIRCNQRAQEMSDGRFPSQFHTLDRALAGELSNQTARDRDRWIHSVAAPIYLDGKIIGGVAVNTDVTQPHLQDEALRKSEKLAAVGQLASSIAHEINNPLESITNLLFLIGHAGSIEDAKEYAKTAQEELSRVTEITLQTLRFHRQQSKPSQLDLADLLRAVLSLYTGRMLVRNIACETKLLSSASVRGLEGEVRQVINNLIRNSLDAIGSKGRILVRLHSQLHPKTGEEGVRITIADTGEGISPRIQSRLFEPFQTTKELTGTGLGLWVSKGIVEKHGGYIQTKTRRGYGHGTVFTVWLPMAGRSNLIAVEG